MYIYSKTLFLVVIATCLAQQTKQIPEIKFVHLTDLHLSVGNSNDFLLQKIKKLINDSKNEFVVMTGDLSNRGDDDELKFLFSGKTFDSRKEYYFWCLGYVYLFYK